MTIEQLVERVEGLTDQEARAAAQELVRSVMSLHAEAIARMLELASEKAPDLGKVWGDDEIVSRVLTLHGLHPEDFGARLARAFENLQTWFDTRGARIELVEAAPHMVRLRYTAARRGMGGAARRTIEDAIYEAAPEIEKLVIEGTDDEEHDAAFVPLSSLLVQTA